MFVNCPSCRGLVATDPATDLPPERCPRCAAPLRESPAPAAAAADARSGVAAAMAEAFGHLDGNGAADPAEDRAAQPAISIANLLQAEPAVIEPELDVVATDATAVAAAPAPPHVPAPAPAPTAPEDVVVAPALEPATLPEASAEQAAPPDLEPEPDPEPEQEPATTPATAPALPATTATATASAPARPRRAAPSFARMRQASASGAESGPRWLMPAAIGGLALLLGLQWLLADRARLAADPAWRPVVAAACGLLRCSLPPWREPTAFALLERDVRPHPQAADTLRITASFRNDAAWAQPWPEVVLTLSDIDGRPLGARAFRPEEYLGGQPPSALLDAGQGAMIRMDVLEPGPGAVSFAFDFR